MKISTTSFTFNAAAKTINFSTLSGFNVRGLLAILNGAAVLYVAGSAGYAFANVTGSTITLNASVSTTGMSNNDPLYVLYDDGQIPAADGTDANGITPPSGGVGIRGWLSGIYSVFNAGTAKAKIWDGTNTANVSSGGGLIVSGLTAVAAPPVNNPVSISGIDGSGNKRHLLTDSDGTQLQIDRQLVPKGYFQASVTTAVTLASIAGGSVPSGARLAYIEPEIGDLRLRDDGVAPTGTLGMRLYSSIALLYNGALSAAQIVSVSGSAVTVNVTFYG